MIHINLLPKELQRAAKTPVLLFATIVTGVTLVAVAIVAYAYLWLNVGVLQDRVARKKALVRTLQRNAEQVDALNEDIEDYKEREKAIINIKTNRILWSKKLEELIQLTPGYIWIVRCRMEEVDQDNAPATTATKKGPTTGGSLELMCYSAGGDAQRMTSYFERLKGADEFYLKFLGESIKPDNFFSDFINISRPEWRFVVLDQFKEPNNLRFYVRLDLKPFGTQSKDEA